MGNPHKKIRELIRDQKVRCGDGGGDSKAKWLAEQLPPGRRCVWAVDGSHALHHAFARNKQLAIDSYTKDLSDEGVRDRW